MTGIPPYRIDGTTGMALQMKKLAFIGALLCSTAAHADEWITQEGWYLYHDGKCVIGPNEMHSPFTFSKAAGTNKIIITDDNDGKAEVLKVQSPKGDYVITWFYGKELCYAFNSK